MPFQFSDLNNQQIASLSLQNLTQIVAIDSQSDERSSSIPSTKGQKVLGDFLEKFFSTLGATVERDNFANMIAFLPARGMVKTAKPIALIVHMDTAKGTNAIDELQIIKNWKGNNIPYPKNAALKVNVENYPSLREFVGHDVVFGPGDAPFGLDDKLGITHLMTLAQLLHDHPSISHPPLFIIGRPDEEIGRMKAVEGLAAFLEKRGVKSGYTIDGIQSYEFNFENFNAGHASITFPTQEIPNAYFSSTKQVVLELGGVNTHSATAKAEGYRAATRFAAEVLQNIKDTGTHIIATEFSSNEIRDCDATVTFSIASEKAERLVEEACKTIVGPHILRGASWKIIDIQSETKKTDVAANTMLHFVNRFLNYNTDFVIPAELSENRQGYSAPYRAEMTKDGVVLSVRLRDFETDGLQARKEHVIEAVQKTENAVVTIDDQYINMGPVLQARPILREWAFKAANSVNVVCREAPIRGGTGVDPFLARNITIANLGTGYFAPESEKELTSIQMMVGHARWLCALVMQAGMK